MEKIAAHAGVTFTFTLGPILWSNEMARYVRQDMKLTTCPPWQVTTPQRLCAVLEYPLRASP
jgi:hypothetical protein